MGITINGPSGIDTASLIDQLVALEQTKVTRVQNQKKTYQVKFDAYSKLKSMLADISAKARSINSESSFDIFKTSTTDESIVTAKGGVGAIEGKYDISVYHLAKNEKMISKDGLINSQSASLSSFGITTGIISINGAEITINDTDTIQDLRRKINNATDSQGNKLGVTASVIKVSDTNYRLVLSANKTGAKGIEYKDVTGSTLKDLGIIETVDGEKGNTRQTIVSQGDFKSAFESLATGSTIIFSGIDHDGNVVTNTFVKQSESTTIEEFLSQVKKAFHNMVDVSINQDTGQLVVSDLIYGTSKLAVNTLNISGTTMETTVSAVGKEGSGVLSVGSDAYFSIEGLYMSSESNSPQNVITGVTLQFNSTSIEKSVTISLERDVAGIKKKIQDLLDSYNALVKWIDEATKMPDPKADEGTSAAKGGDLAGDMTAKNLLSRVKSTLQSQMNLFGGTLTSLTMIGIKSDSKTGEMSIDDEMFDKAITNYFDEFKKLFVTQGYSENKNIQYGRSTETVQSGSYMLREIDPYHVEIRLANDTTWYTSDARVGDIITFSDGPAKGLSITAPEGSIGSTETPFIFSRGIADRITDLISSINAAGTGSIAIHQESITSMMKNADSRIDMLQRSVDAYHDRLVKQFAAMEEALSKLRAQGNNMLNALGYKTSG
jgi:flagellar capping protein FliD